MRRPPQSLALESRSPEQPRKATRPSAASSAACWARTVRPCELAARPLAVSLNPSLVCSFASTGIQITAQMLGGMPMGIMGAHVGGAAANVPPGDLPHVLQTVDTFVRGLEATLDRYNREPLRVTAVEEPPARQDRQWAHHMVVCDGCNRAPLTVRPSHCFRARAASLLPVGAPWSPPPSSTRLEKTRLQLVVPPCLPARFRAPPFLT